MAKKRVKHKVRNKPRKKNKHITRFFILLVVFIALLYVAFQLAKSGDKEPKKTEHIAKVDKPQKPTKEKPQSPRNSSNIPSENQIYYFAEEFGIPKRLVNIENKKDYKNVHLPINPVTSDINYANFKLTQYLHSLGWDQISGKESNNQKVQTLTWFSRKDKIEYRFLVYLDTTNSYSPEKRKVSIIVKGFGTMPPAELDRWLRIEKPICYAVLPVSRVSRSNITSITGADFEALLQLPLEDPGFPAVFTPDYAIFGHFKDSEVITKLDGYFRLLPKASGVITHQGGLITTDSRIMPIILNYIKQKHLYFIDDKAIETSIAFAKAQEIVLTSYEKSITFNPALYKNDTNNAKLKNDIKAVSKDPLIITLQKPDTDTLDFVRKLIDVVEGMGMEIVPVSDI